MPNAISESHELPVDLRTLRVLLKLSDMDRKSLAAALMECTEEVQREVVRMIDIIEDSKSTDEQRRRASSTIRDALHLQAGQAFHGMSLAKFAADAAALNPELGMAFERMNSQEAAFAERLRSLLESKGITQTELASRVGCSQPAISQMLNRACRPQRQTIFKLAAALGVHPRELWPDLEVTEILDTVAAAQQDDAMSEEEAAVLRCALERTPVDTPTKGLPKRKR
jgi:transcriptional regulator with XRE-family HTH domain